jgi:uncharacterized protein (DUF58 family)
MSILDRLRNNIRARIRRRHGHDTEPFIISNRRVYILPTRLGLMFSALLFLMFLGSMNYANNLALGLTFLLASLALIAMHHCHRNLVGIRVSSSPNSPVFAGEVAQLHLALANESNVTRFEFTVGRDKNAVAKHVDSHSHAVLSIALPTLKRGRIAINEVTINSRFPFGLFRAWTYAYLPLSCIVYPKPSEHAPDPINTQTSGGTLNEHLSGDDDFAGLRRFQPGDSPRRVAWKQYAHGQALQTKVFAASTAISHDFDYDSLNGYDSETRLSVLCRWIEDAHSTQQSFGLKLPGLFIETNSGAAHRQRCLTALAIFGLDLLGLEKTNG